MDKKIAYITDIHLDEKFPVDCGVDAQKNWKTLLQDISSRQINQIIFGGDIGLKSSNKWFFDSLKEYNLAITLGNHDSFDEVIKYYNFENSRNQIELYYTQELEYFKFIFLDSSKGFISEQQLNWLTKELITQKKIVIFIHHPILAIEAEVDKRFALQQRGRIQTALLSSENEIYIFCGHYHFNDTQHIENIIQQVTPASSYQVEKLLGVIKINNAAFGYRIIELKKDTIQTNLVTFPNS
ncbi:metallophosphoesterase family protein [Aquimarina intermedia]|uniref:Icc protein n=1 Tax=Aquimarina intermedia TaxID=350814 RepID=A0A5S5C0X3_9FLAO|nr:metallophosphoesterase [Aquimarina intermedia]TYP71613.1 Icc protein [Aquimarina intermedia]